VRAEIRNRWRKAAGNNRGLEKKANMPQANANLPRLDLPILLNDASTLDGRLLSVFKGLNRVKGGLDEREKV
jgi:hypothetical protein